MKKIFLLIISVVYIFSFSKCTGNDDKKISDDTTKIKKVTINKSDTTVPESKHLAFLNSDVLKKIENDRKKFQPFLNYFEPVSKDSFEKYYSYFQSIFKIGTGNPTINNFNTLPFSLYDKFNDFQYYLGLRTDTFNRPGSLGARTITFKNKVRIYPAINSSSKLFYLVFMAETEDITTTPNPDTVTNRNIYYRIKEEVFDMIPLPEMQQAEDDIRNFQTTWNNFNGPTNPGLHFDTIHSFSYSIAEYNQLLSSTPPYWDLANFQTDASPKKLVRIHPIVIVYDPLHPFHVSFKLVFVPFYINRLGREKRDDSRGFFDNMDVCPDKCPKNEIQ